jgi:hypothetical protein
MKLTSHRSTRLARTSVALLAVTLLMGADCPLQVGTGETGGGGGGGGGAGEAVNIGGDAGALWKVETGDKLLVTLVADGRSASAQVEVGRGDVTLLGRTISVADLCWRPEIACPQHILAQATAIRQEGAAVQLTYNPRGPLSLLQGDALGGQLAGKELLVPLGVGNAASGLCGLLSTSAIGATAFSAGADGLATAMSGRVAVTYGGTCVALGGSAAMGADDVLQISASFDAVRQ